MNVLVTGNLGYIGSILTDELLKLNFNVVGLDNNYFKDCKLFNKKNNFKQIVRDIRDINHNDLKNIDFIIHLAGLSNDPLGELNKKLTMDINFRSTIKIAKLAKKMGVKRFVYASTQSLYGISNSNIKIKENTKKINPLTAYALSKWKSEKELLKLSSKTFSVTIFRPSTVYGASQRLRCDIVFNNLMASAYTTKTIDILTDGSPWRPVIHVKDVCKAFIAGIIAPINIVESQVFNVGSFDGNFRVRDLARIVKSKFKKSKIKYLNSHTDPRSYQVSFDKIFSKLSNYY
ncbi:SDR family oxidoreductase, partial [Pelagibacteraceae bacterium]|nr:SDR family oxidoreductase [Pelagibacteraceae bacterium]